MLAIHWSPVSNTRSILRNGITKSKRGLFCFPVTGIIHVDRFWMSFFRIIPRRCMRYNGFIFRISNEDMPAIFCHWAQDRDGTTPGFPIKTIDELKADIRKYFLWFVGFYWYKAKDNVYVEPTYEEIMERAYSVMKEDNKLFRSKLKSANDMDFIFEDTQIVLSRSIAPERIIKVLSGSGESGRIISRKAHIKENVKRNLKDIE
jgi:hypothetical protein